MKKTVYFIYFLLVVFLLLIGRGIVFIGDKCEFYRIEGKILVISIVLIGIFGYFLAKILKYKKEIQVIFYVVIPVIFLFLLSNISDARTSKILKKSTTILTKAVVYETHNSKSTFTVRVKFMANNKKFKGSYRVTKKHGKCPKRIQIGDTVLLMYSKKCPAIIDLYKVCPTKAELKKCKNDCYLINGKLIPVSEYKKSKNKELY